jgi:energy-coupling factor transporter ATP-binding protein EcfA2
LCSYDGLSPYFCTFRADAIDTSLFNLHGQIQKISDNEESYSDPSHIHTLPFPSTNAIPSRFSVSETHSISYMGREGFADVWKAWIKVNAEPYYRQAIYVYGSMGYGKSHILVALACLLIRKGERVVYIPDFRAMLCKPEAYLQNAILMAFPDSASSFYQNWASQCATTRELISLCDHYRKMKGQLCFIIDQFNAFDPESLGDDDVGNVLKEELCQVVNKLSAQHFLITSASANHRTAQHMAAKQTDDQKIALLGGMTPVSG